MKKEHVYIPEPCDASWEQMRGDEQKRFCDHCTKHVHNLSMLTKAEATALLEARGDELCVQYTFDQGGELMFRDNEEPAWRLFSQKEGLKLLLSAAALAVPMLLSACEPQHIEPTPVATSPIKLTEGEAATIQLPAATDQAQGAGRSPSFSPPSEEPAQPEQYEALAGKPSIKLDEEEDKPKPSCDGEEEQAQEPRKIEDKAPDKVKPRFRKLGGKPAFNHEF